MVKDTDGTAVQVSAWVFQYTLHSAGLSGGVPHPDPGVLHAGCLCGPHPLLLCVLVQSVANVIYL